MFVPKWWHVSQNSLIYTPFVCLFIMTVPLKNIATGAGIKIVLGAYPANQEAGKIVLGLLTVGTQQPGVVVVVVAGGGCLGHHNRTCVMQRNISHSYVSYFREEFGELNQHVSPLFSLSAVLTPCKRIMDMLA